MEKQKKLSGKYKNKDISIEIIGESAISGKYMVQVKALVSNKTSKELLAKLGEIETCYRLTQNAFYTQDELEAILMVYGLE